MKKIMLQFNALMKLFLIILSLSGIFDTTYLVASYYNNQSPVCVISSNCDQVLNSHYATIGSVPLSLVGLIYYAVIFLLALDYWQNNRRQSLKILFFIISLGLMVSLWLIYLQAFVINAWCQYCVFSAAVTTLLFIVNLILLKRQPTNENFS